MNVPEHGLTGYRVYKCRCNICRAATATYMREYRATNRDSAEADRTAELHAVCNERIESLEGEVAYLKRALADSDNRLVRVVRSEPIGLERKFADFRPAPKPTKAEPKKRFDK